MVEYGARRATNSIRPLEAKINIHHGYFNVINWTNPIGFNNSQQFHDFNTADLRRVLTVQVVDS